MLGVPVGSEKFVGGVVGAVVSALTRAMAKALSLSDPHTSSLLLRSCLGVGKVSHLSRGLLAVHAASLGKLAGDVVRSVWGDLVGCRLGDEQWGLAHES